MSPDQDDFRRRAVRAVLTVTGIAAVIGLVLGVLATGVVYMSGVLPESEPTPTLAEETTGDEDTIPTPSLSPTASPAPATSSSPSPSPTKTSTKPSPSPTRSRKPERRQPIQLRASTDQASSFERVTLSGSYPGGNGTTLEVQRREGGSWASFPTSATVEGGTFSTYVASGQPGRNAFRVVDPSTGRASNVVAFTVS